MPQMLIGYGPGCAELDQLDHRCHVQTPIKDRALRIIATTVHPKYFSESEREQDIGDDYHDIGLITFDGELPIATTPIAAFAEFHTRGDDLKLDNEVVKTGYGTTNENDDSPPALRGVTLRVASLDPEHAELEYMRHAQKGTCPGDSGSPGFTMPKAGLPKVLGITSRGPDASVRGSHGKEMTCDDGNGIDTDIRYYRDWLQCTSERLQAELSDQATTVSPLQLQHEAGDQSLADCAATAIESHGDFYARVKASCERRPGHRYDEETGACEDDRDAAAQI